MDLDSILKAALAALSVGSSQYTQQTGIYFNMDDDDTISASEEELRGLSDMEKQRVSLQTYLNALPYECESVDYMQARLEEIVGKIFICAKAQNWLVLTTWDGMLQCWLLMRYPIAKSTRAKLVRLYYELCILPGIESRVIRSWADMLSRLLANKSGVTRKLESTELELPWKPLWDALQKELWPKKRIQEPSRNVVNILLYVAEQCKRYYPTSEIPNMLSTFIPLITKESIMTMVPVMTSFLPPAQAHLYLPVVFALWEAFNSSVLDDRFLELAGDLSEEHISGPAKSDSRWKDVGIWSENEWTTLIGKGLGSMNVPVGAIGGASTTAAMADIHGDRQSLRIKKTINRQSALAKIIVYSIAVDGSERASNITTPSTDTRALPSQPNGYLAGSKALDSLDRLITCTESFFHPSNSGHWSPALTTFLHRLTAEFIVRVKQEEQHSCTVPQERRLTPSIRRNFVKILRTPALIAMFSKDPISMSYAQGSLRTMALLEPDLIMPELLERAYGGLEAVNETHRTTAVLGMLSGICAPLVTERMWLGGQKHIVPLLELCIPGIDLNDPTKTICATMFIVSAVQHIKVGELSHQSGLPLDSEDPVDEMGVDVDSTPLPDGVDIGDVPRLSKSEERALTVTSSSGFADWLASLFRRVFALFENLPEEGGRKNTTGGKQEEGVLKSIKSMLDVVCLHLSDKLFDLVLNIVYNYATTNAKSNAVRAFGQLVACLARVKPKETIAKFFSFCSMQIEEELKHGASSVRTTSSHTAVPSDTTFHWNLTILRGCLGYGGAELLRYKSQILQLFGLLIEKTKSERGYTGGGRLIMRVLHTLVGTYPLNSRFVNTAEWESPGFDDTFYSNWGKLYEAKDVVIEWHVPSPEEIGFVIEILDVVFSPALDKVDSLLESFTRWDNVARNDFCRYLHACRAMWNGLPTFLQEQNKECNNMCMYDDIEATELLVTPLCLNAGFALTDPKDQHYQRVSAHRTRFGTVIRRAASTLRQRAADEDHIDAVIAVIKGIDSYLLDYGMTRGTFESLQTSYIQARDLNRTWSKQKENSRLVFVKRAQVYHSGRVYMHSLYRRRSSLDDELIGELVELSLSPYTRIRRQAQSVLHSVCGYYVRSTRLILPRLFDALAKGNDPDRMKGALYVLGNKGIASYSLADYQYRGKHLLALLECQHEEKPSVQKLVNSLSNELLTHLSEEAIHTDAYTLDTPRLNDVLLEMTAEFSPSLVNQHLFAEVTVKSSTRVTKREAMYQETISSILDVALRPQTHWRYVQMALKFLFSLLRRDVPTSPEIANFFMELCTSPQPSIRVTAQKAVNKMLMLVKIRSYSKSGEELWMDKWQSPLQTTVFVEDPHEFLANLQRPLQDQTKDVYVDTIYTGFLSWTSSVKGYIVVTGDSTLLSWKDDCQPCLNATREVILKGNFFQNLATLWGQESSRTGGVTELRSENVTLIKALAKMLESECLDGLLDVIEPLIFDPDRFKQRAGVELLTGLLRGSKHWPRPLSDHLWSWVSSRLDKIYVQIKPDTLVLWESLFSYQLLDRDPRRSTPLIDWVLGQTFDFNRESAFEMSKQIALFGTVVDCMGNRFNSLSDKYVRLFMDNLNNGYAEIRAYIAEQLYMINRNLWQPYYPSTDAFLEACSEPKDPLRIRQPTYLALFEAIVEKMPQWRSERLPPPWVTQSEYDKVGLTLLQWIWTSVHGAQACLVFPYAIRLMPETLRMAELSDSPELQRYSTAVLYVISAVTPPPEYVQIILNHFVEAIKSSTSWRIRLHALPALVVFFYRNLLSISFDDVSKIMDCLLTCLGDENVEVRAMASKALSGIVRCSQRQSIVPLKNRFVQQTRRTRLPGRRDPQYTESLRSLHSAILGLCALIESFPYSIEPWMPPLTEVLAPHATDPPPISTTIRQCASEFKKTHQDTWHKDQLAFDEDQLQSLSTMLVGTSYYA